MTRQMRFGPSVFVDAVPQVLITIAAWPLARVWPSYAVLVWLLLTRQMASTLASHLVAESWYGWHVNWKAIREILSFGWPMLVTGLLTFALVQGDRFALGIAYPTSELAVYTVAASVVLLPALTMRRLAGYILLPILSACQDDPVQFRRRASEAAQA